jgi:DNA modification methylase
MVKLSTIKLNPKNPRFIRDDKYKKLLQSLKDFPKMMELRPIIVDEANVIQGGNMRFRALNELGFKEIPDSWVKQGKDLTPEQWKEFVVKDNVSYGEWDFDLLSADYEVEQLEAWGMDFPEFTDESEEQEAKDDGYEIPAKVETNIKLGDLFEIGPHRLLCGDSTKTEDAGILFSGKMADLVLTDPPYNVNYEGASGNAANKNKVDGGNRNTRTILNDHMSDSNFYQFLLDFYKTFAEKTKPGGAWYVWHADTEGFNFRRAFIESGLEMKQCLIWVKNSLVMGRQDYQWRHEPCLYGWKPGAAHFFIDDRTQTTVIDDNINLKKLSKDEMYNLLKEIFSEKVPTSVIYHDKPIKNDMHPTMKPVGLMGYLIKNSSKRLQIVADPFLGSGSTMVACHQLNRRCYGMELDPIYCEVIIDRMKKLDSNIVIKKNGVLVSESAEAETQQA